MKRSSSDFNIYDEEEEEVPPAPSLHRHPASNPREIHRRMAIQCQYCWKPGAEATLSKCGGCRAAIYCSKKCQKAAWPKHKDDCRVVRERRQATDAGVLLLQRSLNKFVEKHRPTILNTSYRALDIERNPARALEDVLFVQVRQRPGRARTETSYYVTDAEVIPIDSFENASDQMRQCLKDGPGGVPVTEDQKNGIFHAYMVVFATDDDRVTEFIPVAFSTKGEKDIYSHGEIPGMTWKEQLITVLNEGIVY